MVIMENNTILIGGEFLVKEAKSKDIFIPEEFDEEQKLIAESCSDFLKAEVFPNLDRIDSQEEGLMRELIVKSGEMGFLGICVPEEYEGFGQSFVTSMLANEVLGAGYSFAVAFSAHTGIGTLPVLYYGNEEQKKKYLPGMATGELAACFCLTEPNAGSDANSGKTKAVLSEDGKHYILNGQKIWITNGGFADIQIVFAKIENDRVLSAFIVERDWTGVVRNPEEKKMGIKGSSTVQLFYNDVKVPVENLLGKRGEGYRIALNILHIGRIKLCANVLGAAKLTINDSVNYANERKQFGSLISEFGAIKHKLAEQVIKTFATESALYRATQDIENSIQRYLDLGKEYGKANVESTARFSVECALLKVLGSETVDYIVDEAVQIFGGMGFSSETSVERAYRDSRINRIFEGTNEINRTLITDATLKNAQKGEFDLATPAKEILESLKDITSSKSEAGDYFEEKKENIRNFKKSVLMTISTFFEKFSGGELSDEHEIQMNISDMMIPTYASESTLLRIEKMESLDSSKDMAVYKDILDVLIYDSANIILKAGSDAINSFVKGEDKELMLNGLLHFTKVNGVDVKKARRNIADKLIEDNRYNF